jgi:hypothetical protein
MTVHNRFGSWNETVRTAGYSPNKEESYTGKDLLAILQQAAATDNIDQFDSPDNHYPGRISYDRRFGGIPVAALRGSIDIERTRRQRAVPLTREELDQFVSLISNLDPHDQAVSMVALLTGCADVEHRWVGEHGIDDTKTHSTILFPAESRRGNRSVAIGPLYNQFVRNFDSISTERLKQAVEYSNYPPAQITARNSLFQISNRIEFDIDRPVIEGQYPSRCGTVVLHRDLRCTHYLFEFCHGASEAMLKRRLALSDDEIRHYHRFLDEDEEDWSVRIEWRD